MTGINTAVEQLADPRDKESFGRLSTLEKDLALHLGGHVNHSACRARTGRADVGLGCQRMIIIEHFDDQVNVPICMVPLLMLDIGKHTYYLQYKDDKAAFSSSGGRRG